MPKLCRFCYALTWPGEPNGICCSNGKVQLPKLDLPPDEVSKLLTDDTIVAKHFREKIRNYFSKTATPTGTNYTSSRPK